MFDRQFFASKLGASALVSVAAMVAFNLYAASLQLDAPGLADRTGEPVIAPLVVLA